MKSDDDEIKRQLFTEQIKWWIKQAEDDILALKGSLFLRKKSFPIISFFLDEAKLVQFSREPIPPVTTNPVPPKNNLPMDGPFTLVTAKDRLYKEAVGGVGYPR